jgi:hypothetical protein
LFTVTTALVITGLLVRVSAHQKHAAPARAATVEAADPGHCHEPRRELRFGWLKPGEEPMPTSRSPVCHAVYRN